MRRLKLKRGISPVIAVLLLIAIAVAAAIITYAWVSGLLASLTGTGGGQQVSEQLIMVAYDFKTDLDDLKLKLYVRNVGTSSVDIDAIYYDGSEVSTFTITIDTTSHTAGETPITLDVQEVAEIQIKLPVSEAPSKGTSHTVKIVTVTGAQFTFNLIAGRKG